MRDAIQKAVEKNGDTLISVDGKADQSKQNDAIDKLVTSSLTK